MKELIAVAQARRFSRSTSFSDNLLIGKYTAKTSVSTPLKEGQGQLSPSNRIIKHTSTNDSIHSKSPFESLQHNDVKTEANVARKAFGAFLGTLTRTKENIARATRLAIECAKHGIAGEVRPCISLLYFYNYFCSKYHFVVSSRCLLYALFRLVIVFLFVDLFNNVNFLVCWWIGNYLVLLGLLILVYFIHANYQLFYMCCGLSLGSSMVAHSCATKQPRFNPTFLKIRRGALVPLPPFLYIM
jgi:hypothetical protein